LDNEIRIAEVYFFIYICRDDEEMALALVSLYSRPDPTLLSLSVNTLWSCEYEGDRTLRFINVKTIHAVVAMIPHRPVIGGWQMGERFFLVEKPGLDVVVMSGVLEHMPEDEEGVADNS
jgi:hypothetical protein